MAGEPLAWITGHVSFCGRRIVVRQGVYVPRWQSEPLARRAVAVLPAGGRMIDLCTGSGAIAATVAAAVDGAQVVATDDDDTAVACATGNGVDARRGDLFSPCDPTWRGHVDVITAVAPYVPSAHLSLLRSTEPVPSLDGGEDGLDVVRRIVRDAPRWLAPGGHLLLEVGAPQVEAMHAMTDGTVLRWVDVLVDGDGDVSGVHLAKSA